MTATWKSVERRICREWQGERRGPLGRESSDCVDTPLALEIKRSKSMSIRTAWISQAKENGRKEGKPWALVVCGHHDRNPLAVVEHSFLLQLARQAGLLAPDGGSGGEAGA